MIFYKNEIKRFFNEKKNENPEKKSKNPENPGNRRNIGHKKRSHGLKCPIRVKPKETIPTGKSKLVTRSEYSKIKYNFKIKIFYFESNA